VTEKPARIVIRCSKETHDRFHSLKHLSGHRDSEEFLNRLLDLYECLKEMYVEKKIDRIKDMVCTKPVIVRPQY